MAHTGPALPAGVLSFLRVSMTSRTVPLDGTLHDYLMAIGLTEHPVMRELREFTAGHRMAKMQIAPEQGQFMGWLVQLLGVRRYLEIGVFTGYSMLAAMLAMPADGDAVACDVSEEFTSIARDYWQRAGVAGRIRLELQPALLTLQQLLAEGRPVSSIWCSSTRTSPPIRIISKPACNWYGPVASSPSTISSCPAAWCRHGRKTRPAYT
jgi:hypothetical protein